MVIVAPRRHTVNWLILATEKEINSRQLLLTSITSDTNYTAKKPSFYDVLFEFLLATTPVLMLMRLTYINININAN